MSCPACGAATGDSDRFCAGCGAPLRAAAPSEARKKVSVLFLDLVGSTQLAEGLDPEPLREIMDAYFAICSASIAEHGGRVEKFIGDAVMAVFGVGVAHEDDAVRAVRAAAAALAALDDLGAEFAGRYHVGIQARCGVCTGDVVVLTSPGGDFRIIGDAGNTASRLQSAAPPGGIILDPDTAALVRSEVGIEPVEPLRLKGKAQPVQAWRVVDAAAASVGAWSTPFLGRAAERDELRRAFRAVAADRRPALVTVLGPPGIGKSRLVHEFVGELPDSTALVLSGRCSAYGRGITYKPLAEMLASYPGGWPALAALLGADSLAAGTLATVVDDAAAAAGPSVGTADIAWAVRELLRRLAGDRPTILVWDELHRAEETLLDLIADLAVRLTDIPVLMLCVARGELIEARPDFGRAAARAVELGPLPSAQCVELVSRLILREDVYAHDHTGVCERVADQCEGNPLFAELITAVLSADGPDRLGGPDDSAVRIPPTIHAVLGARLDRVPGPERALVEPAATVGGDLPRGLLPAMAAADGTAGPTAAALTAALERRRVLVRTPAGSIRFAQALLRETAYEFTPKSRRQRWHDFLAPWYADRDDAMAAAYHVEASWRLRRELRPGGAELPELATSAADTLTAEGMRALTRKDLPAAVQLLTRARDLLPAGDPRHTALAVHISDAGLWLWDAELGLDALAAAEAALPDDFGTAAVCAAQRGILSLRLGLEAPERVAAQAERIADGLRRRGPGGDGSDGGAGGAGSRGRGGDLAWCRLHYLQACLHLVAERAAAADTALRSALAHAGAIGDAYESDRLVCARCELAQWTPAPVVEGLELCDRLTRRFAANRALLLPVLLTRANLLALSGDLDGARRELAAVFDCVDEVRLDLAAAAAWETAGWIESLAGRPEQAEAGYRRALDVLRARGQAPDALSLEVQIARTLFDQGRIADAGAELDRIAAASPRARIAAAALRGRILSARDDHEAAVAAARDALSLSADTDDPRLIGQAGFDLAIVAHAAGRLDEAAVAATDALRRFEAKGATGLAAAVREWLDAGGAIPRDSGRASRDAGPARRDSGQVSHD